MTSPSTTEYREIPLTRGQAAIVDAADFDWLNQWIWYAQWNKRKQDFYASRAAPRGCVPCQLRMHRVILRATAEFQVDHINGNPLDNRRSNLRLATHQQNTHNRDVQRNNTSGYKGVSWHKGKRVFIARITLNSKQIQLGGYATAEEAHRAYVVAAERLHGQFSNTGSKA